MFVISDQPTLPAADEALTDVIGLLDVLSTANEHQLTGHFNIFHTFRGRKKPEKGGRSITGDQDQDVNGADKVVSEWVSRV